MNATLIERFTAHWQRTFWDEAEHPRETAAHEGKRPGEFAPKQGKGPTKGEKAVNTTLNATQTTVKPTDYGDSLKKAQQRRDPDGISTQPADVMLRQDNVRTSTGQNAKTPEKKPDIDKNVSGHSADRLRLVLTNQGLAGYWAKKYAKQTADYDDLVQEANIALIRATKDWDESKSQFSSYASLYIKNAVSRAAARLKKNQSNGGDEPTAEIEEHRSSVDRAEQIDEVQQRMERLSGPQRQLIERLFGIGRPAQSVAQIAEAMGKSRQYVNQEKNRALEAMQYSASQFASILRFDSTTLTPDKLPPIKPPQLPKPTLAAQKPAQKEPVTSFPKIDTSPSRPTKIQKPSPMEPYKAAYKEAKADITTAPAKVKDWTKNTLIPDAKAFAGIKPPKLTQPTDQPTKTPTTKPTLNTGFTAPKSRLNPTKTPTDRPTKPLPAGIQLQSAPKAPKTAPQTAANPTNTGTATSAPSSYGEYIAAKRTTRAQDRQEDRQLRQGGHSKLLRSLQAVFPQRGPVNRALGALARRGEGKTQEQLDHIAQQRANRDQQFEAAYHEQRRQAKAQGKVQGKQPTAQPGQQPQGHGFNPNELKQLQDLGFDDNAIKAMWQERSGEAPQDSQTGKPRRLAIPNPKASKPQPEPTQAAQAPAKERLHTASIAWWREQFPKQPAEPDDPTGLGHDPELSEHDSRHEMLFPDDAKKYQAEADAAWKQYQATGDEQHALAAASRVRQLKLHGYDHPLPHSKQGIIDYHQKQQDKKKDVELAKQWHDSTIALKSNPDDKFHAAAVKNIEKHFQNKGVDIQDKVFGALKKNQEKQIQTDLADYAKHYPATLQPPRDTADIKSRKAVRDIRQKFVDQGLDIDKMLQEAYGDKFTPKAAAPEPVQAAPAPAPAVQPQSPPITPGAVPEMIHAQHHTLEEREQSEQLRDKMVELSKPKEPDPVFDQADSSASYDNLKSWRGQKAKVKTPLDRAIVDAVGTDDYIVHKIVSDQIKSLGTTDINKDRNEAIRNAVGNIVSKQRFPQFMAAVKKAEDPDSIPQFDLIVQTIMSDPSLSTALAGKSRAGQGDIEARLFESLKSGMSDSTSHADRVEEAIQSLGGHDAIQQIMDYYNRPASNLNPDETIPFSVQIGIMRLAASLSTQQTRRHLGLPHNQQVIQRFSAPRTLVERFAAAWN